MTIQHFNTITGFACISIRPLGSTVQDVHASIVLPKGHIDSICPLGHTGFPCIYTSLGSFSRTDNDNDNLSNENELSTNRQLSKP